MTNLGEETEKNISYSELSVWNTCPYKHKLLYIDRLTGPKSIHLFFGSAIHSVCEQNILEYSKGNQYDDEYWKIKFKESFDGYLNKNKECNISENDVNLFTDQGYGIIPNIVSSFAKRFGDIQFLGSEKLIRTPYKKVENVQYFFKGYVDLLFLEKSSGKYIILDWKTCSWGWDKYKKGDKMTIYQLVLYKHFISRELGVDPKNIDIYFALLKRTANKSKNIEFFRATSGKKRTEDAIKLLDNCIINVHNGRIVKNRMSCEKPYKCDFYRTKYCK